jgi:hypothetical protein
MSMGRDYVSELRLLTGLLFILQVIHEHVELRWNDNDEGNRTTRRETCPSATLSATCTELRVNPGLRGKRPATNRLSHGTATSGKISWKCNFFECIREAAAGYLSKYDSKVSITSTVFHLYSLDTQKPSYDKKRMLYIGICISELNGDEF